jgi:mRNA-degrading endonuclease toxin of MazEF toxin-antitoxin module
MAYDLDKMYCGAIKRGEVFLVQKDHEEKLVVVVQDNILNERLATVLAVPVEPRHEQHPVYRNELGLKPSETSLGRPAVCVIHQLQPVDRRHVIAKTGELTPERLQELYEIMDVNFGRFRDKN